MAAVHWMRHQASMANSSNISHWPFTKTLPWRDCSQLTQEETASEMFDNLHRVTHMGRVGLRLGSLTFQTLCSQCFLRLFVGTIGQPKEKFAICILSFSLLFCTWVLWKHLFRSKYWFFPLKSPNSVTIRRDRQSKSKMSIIIFYIYWNYNFFLTFLSLVFFFLSTLFSFFCFFLVFVLFLVFEAQSHASQAGHTVPM